MSDRFNDYRDIRAQNPQETATCGHEIAVDDPIGWNPRNKNTLCKDCWTRWVAENHEADMAERCCF